MHATLFIGKDSKTIDEYINNHVSENKLNLSKITVEKIDDVKTLNKALKFSFEKPTTFLIKGVDKITTEAANAFLKNLEEPPQNVDFILTAQNEDLVLPTIISRCNVVKINTRSPLFKNDSVEKFIAGDTSERFEITDQITDREDAVRFLEELLKTYHQNLINNPKNKGEIIKKISKIDKTLKSLNANTNIYLSLSELVINIE